MSLVRSAPDVHASTRPVPLPFSITVRLGFDVSKANDAGRQFASLGAVSLSILSGCCFVAALSPGSILSFFVLSLTRQVGNETGNVRHSRAAVKNGPSPRASGSESKHKKLARERAEIGSIKGQPLMEGFGDELHL